MRGYFGIGIVGSKCPENLGMLWRSAQAFEAAFLFTIGARYPTRPSRQPTDTTKATRHVPLYYYDDGETFQDWAKPVGARLVIVETKVGKYEPTPLDEYTHPERAIYLLGAEDRGVPVEMIEEEVNRPSERADLVQIPTSYCLNVAVAGSIVMYDRIAKL